MEKQGRLFCLIMIIGLITAFFLFDLTRYFTLESIKQQQALFLDFYANNRLITISVFMAVYMTVTALSLPGAALMTIAAGAMFDLLWGTVIVSFASTGGATLAFTLSRFIFRDLVQKRYGDKLKAINEGVKKDGALYLFSLRLVPAFPFFLINLLMGLTPIRTRVFYLISQIGMLPGTIVFVNAGTRIGKIESESGIMSPGLIISFALLGLFPFMAKRAVTLIQRLRSS